jgi:hypothetical protein
MRFGARRRGMLAAFYLHLWPFSRFVVSVVDRQIAEIDSRSGGRWDLSCAPHAAGRAIDRRAARLHGLGRMAPTIKRSKGSLRG